MISLSFQNLNIMQDLHFMFQHRYITHDQGHVSLWISLSIFWRTFLLFQNICLFAQHKYTNELSFFIMMHMINALISSYYLVGWKLIITYWIIFLILLKRTVRAAFVNLFCKPHILHFYYNGLQRRNGPTCYLTSCIKKNGF